MPITNFNGQLRSNEIFAAIYNMIISQQVFADNIKGTYSSLVESVRTDGTLFGDTKLFYSTDVLSSAPWGNDAEAQNLLKLYRPEAPECQAVTIDQFRQIALTVDNYLSKRAWGDEGAFGSFNSVMLGWIRDTKRVYDSTLVNAFFGTHETSEGKQKISITLPTVADDAEKENRLQAQTIAQELADLIVEMEDVSRDYNDYGNLRSYEKGDLKVIWNSDFLNKIKYIDLPTIYHNELFDDLKEKLPPRYFGTVITGKPTGNATGTVRSLIEQDVDGVHLFPGDSLPNGKSGADNSGYLEDHTIICKVVHKDAVKFMSAFEVGTSFFNPKSLTETHYLTWGYSDPTQLHNYPFVTIRGVEA